MDVMYLNITSLQDLSNSIDTNTQRSRTVASIIVKKKLSDNCSAHLNSGIQVYGNIECMYLYHLWSMVKQCTVGIGLE